MTSTTILKEISFPKANTYEKKKKKNFPKFLINCVIKKKKKKKEEEEEAGFRKFNDKNTNLKITTI